MDDETTVLVQTVGGDGKPPEIVRVRAKEETHPLTVIGLAIAGLLGLMTVFIAVAALIIAMNLSHKLDALITLHEINAETITCGVNETFVHETRTTTGISFGGSCAVVPNASDINVNTTVCASNEALLGATYQKNGDTIVGTCFALNANGTLPDINNGTLTCTGQQIAATRTITGPGLAQDPFCLLPVTNLSILGTTHQVNSTLTDTNQWTLSTPTTFIAPGTIQDTTGMIYSTNGTMAATGTTQGAAAVLTKSYNVITSTSAGNTAVKLPVTPTPGLRVVVANYGDRAMTVFPGASGFIDNGGINGGVPLALNAIATYQAFSATQWLTVNPPVVAGAAITVSYLNGVTQVSNTGVTSIAGTAGQITASGSTGAVTLSLAANGVTPGTYGGNNTDLTIVIDAEGRITTATSTNNSCGGGCVIPTKTSNSAITTDGWQGGNAHNITAYLKKSGEVVTCILIDNTGFTQINDNVNPILIPALIPVGYRPVAPGASYTSAVFASPGVNLAAFYDFDSSGDVFISAVHWDGTYNSKAAWVLTSNLGLNVGIPFTWATAL